MRNVRNAINFFLSAPFRSVYRILYRRLKRLLSAKNFIQQSKSSLAYEDALEYIETKLNEKKSYDLLIEKVEILIEILEFDKALQILNEDLMDYQSYEVHYMKAQCLQKLGQFSEEIEKSYKQALKLAPSEAKDSLAYLYFSYMWEAYPLNENLLKQITNFINNADDIQRELKSYGKIKLLSAAIHAEVGQMFPASKLRKEAKLKKAVDKNFMFLRYRERQRGDLKALNKKQYDYFEKLLGFQGELKKLILDANGDVCIVGNSPTLLGSGKGEEIDSHKLVIRFNSYNTEYPYSEDYGCKTDVWVRMPFHPYVKNRPEPGHKLIMFSGSNRYHRPYAEWDGVFELIEEGYPVEFFDAKSFYELQEKLGAPPTAGLMLCYSLYKMIGPLKKSNYYGFSYLQEVSGAYHYSDSNANSGKRHCWSSEAEVFSSLLSENEESLLVSRVMKSHIHNKEVLNERELSEVAKFYDYVITTSPGLSGYKIHGKYPLYISSLASENYVKFLDSAGSEGKDIEELDGVNPDSLLVLGFGRAKTGQAAVNLADAIGADFNLVEYGLISSMALPSEKQFNFSLILDDTGIFYDTTQPSQIENILYGDESINLQSNLSRATNLIKLAKEYNITKYNNSPDAEISYLDSLTNNILVIDQTENDNSILLGQCEEYSFEEMLVDALSKENSNVYLKLHPETVAGAKGGNLTTIEKYLNYPNLHLIDKQCNVLSLIKQVDEVYVMTSGVGLEALILGKPVTCFGFPFYAGWGLTLDKVQAANKRKPLTIEALVYATYFKYTSYFHPETQEPCNAEDVMEWIIFNKPLLPKIGV